MMRWTGTRASLSVLSVRIQPGKAHDLWTEQCRQGGGVDEQVLRSEQRPCEHLALASSCFFFASLSLLQRLRPFFAPTTPLMLHSSYAAQLHQAFPAFRTISTDCPSSSFFIPSLLILRLCSPTFPNNANNEQSPRTRRIRYAQVCATRRNQRATAGEKGRRSRRGAGRSGEKLGDPVNGGGRR